MYPADRRYTREHEWVMKEGNSRYRMGLTTYAQEALGEVVFVELPDPGQELASGQGFGAVESVKAVSEVYSPLDGRVEEVNNRLEGEPGLVNRDPYGEGWLAVLAAADEMSYERLLPASEYQRLVEEG